MNATQISQIRDAAAAGAYDAETVIDVTVDRILDYMQYRQRIDAAFELRLAEDETDIGFDGVE